MKRSDHILALTSALLTIPEDKFSQALKQVKEMYELTELRKPGVVSIGTLGKNERGLETWLLDLRNQQILSVSFFYSAVEQNNLPPHMAAAFAGTPDLLMQVKTNKAVQTFLLATYFSQPYEISARQLVDVLNAQTNQDKIWARVSEMILESNRLNNRELFEPSEAAEYLQRPEGRHVLDYQVADLIKEIQIECSIHNQAFVIPERLQSLFVKYGSFGFDDDREYVYLYPTRDVTDEEVLTLTEAQTFEPAIWEELNKTLEEYQDETLKPMPANQWKGKVMSLEGEQLQRIVHPICRSICRLCEEKNVKPVIPAELSDAFGPNEEDQKRAAARSKGEKDRWSLKSTEQPWEYYAFLELEDFAQIASADLHAVKNKFVSALEDIRNFAAHIQSPYEEAFELAAFVLKELKDVNKLTEEMKVAGFSERAIEVAGSRQWISEQFTPVGFTVDQVKALIALSIADVFGGMGSWNDQYVEHDQERYQTVSANTYQQMKDYFAAVISG